MPEQTSKPPFSAITLLVSLLTPLLTAFVAAHLVDMEGGKVKRLGVPIPFLYAARLTDSITWSGLPKIRVVGISVGQYFLNVFSLYKLLRYFGNKRGQAEIV